MRRARESARFFRALRPTWFRPPASKAGVPGKSLPFRQPDGNAGLDLCGAVVVMLIIRIVVSIYVYVKNKKESGNIIASETQIEEL